MDIDKELQDIIERYQDRRKLRNVVNKYKERRKGRIKARAELDRADERWITIGAKEANKRTGEPGHKGRHVLIDDEGVVVAGAGGSLTGVKLGGAKSTSGEVKVDPSKTTGAVGGEKKGGETTPPPKPKVPKWGDFEQKEDVKAKIDGLNEKIKTVEKTSWGTPRIPYDISGKFADEIPDGTVVEIAGRQYIKTGDSGYYSGWIEANGYESFSGTYSAYSPIQYAVNGIKYLGSIKISEMPVPGAGKEIQFEGNYAEEVTKKLWDEAKDKIKCDKPNWAQNFDIVKKMDSMPKGTVIELENGTVFKKYQNDWKIKQKGADTFTKLLDPSGRFASALMGGKVKSITAKAATVEKSGEEGDYDVGIDNPFVAKYGDKYKPMHDIIVKNKGTESTLWKHFESRMKPEAKGKKTCYIPGTWRICLGGGLKGSKGYFPYSETFHEGGHLIDDRLSEVYRATEKPSEKTHGPYAAYLGWSAGDKDKHLSELYEGGKLRKTMEGEWKEAKQKLAEEYVEKMKGKLEAGEYTKLFYAGAISYDDYKAMKAYEGKVAAGEAGAEKPKVSLVTSNCGAMLDTVTGKEWDVYGDVLDMFCMASHGVFGSGHDKGYASSDKHTSTEFFAEAFSAKLCNPESLELIKKYFPKSYDVFEEILEWAGKHYDKM